MNKHGQLDRQLENRHIQLIAIGGAIGVGLFLGSAKGIQLAGPALLLCYLFAGFFIFFIMRALGELTLYRPISGSFSSYAEEWLGERAGFYTGWTYWYLWIVVGMVEITAVGQYAKYWLPEIPPWIPALISLIFVFGLNLIAVKWFGETEFWFALIKVVTIVLLIIFGIVIIVTGFGYGGKPIGISNLWAHGGLFPNGVKGMLLAMQIAVFSFIGVELVGVTAGEAKDPRKTIPSAINKLLWRILIFYVGALFVLLSIYSWSSFDGKISPFVLVFTKIGIPAAAGIINFVVLSAALSSCNSGFYSTGRMLRNLAIHKHAPVNFANVNKRNVPSNALFLSFSLMFIGVVLNYIIPEQAFVIVTSLATIAGVFTWIMIVYSHLRYRQAVDKNNLELQSYRMPGFPWMNYLIIAFLLSIVVLLAFDAEARISLYVTPVWFLLLEVSYRLLQKKRAAVQEKETKVS